jgi:hypothetical protein
VTALTTFFTAPDKRALVLPGVPADHTYTFTVRAYRRVDNDIDPTGYILSDQISAAAYKPIAVPAFQGDITGTIQGRPSLDVVLNLENIASDSILSTTEKPGLILSYNQGIYNWGALDAKATEVGGFPDEQEAAAAAKNALTAYLQSLDPAWDDTTQHTQIDKVVFQNKWASFYSALADLQAAITGRAGADAKTLIVISDRQTINYDGSGSPSPAVQTIRFTAQKQNTTATVSWTVKDINGTARTASSYLSTTTGDSVTMDVAQFDGARNGTKGVIVTASITVDGITITDSISVTAVGDGADGIDGQPGDPGPAGPTISLNATDLSFDYIDGIPVSSAQIITVTATKQNTTEAINWSASPAVTLGAPNANQRTLSLTNFGNNTAVTITATGAVSGASASVTLIRSNSTTPNDSIIPDSHFTSVGYGSVEGKPWTASLGFRTMTP